MDNAINHIRTVEQPIEKKISKKTRVIGGFIREVAAVSFWIYAITKLFIFDIDVFFLELFTPEYLWILNYKLIIITSLTALLWFFTKNSQIYIWFFYVVFYPLIVIFWRIPEYILRQKSWILGFAFFNSVVSFFSSLRYNFITTSIFILAATLIIKANQQTVLIGSIVAILTLVISVYINRVILIFKPSKIFQFYTKIISTVKKNRGNAFSISDEIKSLPIERMSPKQLETWSNTLQISILYNKICLFVSKKLENYQESGLNVLSCMGIILFLILFTVIAFSFVNLGLFKISNSYFLVSEETSYFSFLYYSFNNLLFNNIEAIKPSVAISQLIAMLQSSISLFLVVVFVSVLFSLKGQKTDEELKKIIRHIEAEGQEMEGFIIEEYRIQSIQDAMHELEKLKGGLVALINLLTRKM